LKTRLLIGGILALSIIWACQEGAVWEADTPSTQSRQSRLAPDAGHEDGGTDGGCSCDAGPCRESSCDGRGGCTAPVDKICSGTECSVGVCNNVTGQCELDSGVREGRDCDDGNECTASSRCQDGVCVATTPCPPTGSDAGTSDGGIDEVTVNPFGCGRFSSGATVAMMWVAAGLTLSMRRKQSRRARE
jgi:hypothetical protein